MNRPNLLIIGVAKAGTSSLFAYLARHPDIGCARVKEPYYFYPESGYSRVDSFEEYLGLFSAAGTRRYLMEASAGYFMGGAMIAERIRRELEEPRLAVILRDPVDRALSAFKYETSLSLVDPMLSFDAYIEQCKHRFRGEVDHYRPVFTGLTAGLYADALRDWFSSFDSALRVVFFEELSSRPDQVVGDLVSWLGLPPLRSTDAYERHNVSVSHRSRFLQRLAYAGNRLGEPFLRTHPRLKNLLRAFYMRANAAPLQVEISAPTRRYLHEFFGESNSRVFETLSARGYTDFPDWIARQPTTASAGESVHSG